MRAKSLDKVDLHDGYYKGRLGGTTVVVRLPNKNVRFKVNYDSEEISIGVWVTVKNGYANIVSNGHY